MVIEILLETLKKLEISVEDELHVLFFWLILAYLFVILCFCPVVLFSTFWFSLINFNQLLPIISHAHAHAHQKIILQLEILWCSGDSLSTLDLKWQANNY